MEQVRKSSVVHLASRLDGVALGERGRDEVAFGQDVLDLKFLDVDRFPDLAKEFRDPGVAFEVAPENRIGGDVRAPEHVVRSNARIESRSPRPNASYALNALALFSFSWIVLSIVLSIGLTVLLNVAMRAFPNGQRRLEERAEGWLAAPPDEPPRVRVFFPGKAMLIGSIGLTVLLNVVTALAR